MNSDGLPYCNINEAYIDFSPVLGNTSPPNSLSYSDKESDSVQHVASTNMLSKGTSDSPQQTENGTNSLNASQISVKAINTESRTNTLENINEKRSILSKKIVEYRLYLEQLDNERRYVESQLEVFQKQLNELKEQSLNSKQETAAAVNVFQENQRPLRNKIRIPSSIDPIGDSESIMNILFYIFLILFGYLLAYRLKK